MKAPLSIIASFFVIMSMTSCVKDKHTYTISGTLYQGCTTTPLANQELAFFQSVNANILLQTSGGDLGTTVTDANGRFSFGYVAKNDLNIKIQLPAGFGFSDVTTGVPSKRNIENMNLFYSPRTTIQVRLNVTRPYTSGDTLYIVDYRNAGSFLKVKGPFTSGVLYIANNYGFDSVYDNKSNTTLSFKVGNNSTINTKTFALLPCDTSRVTVDIN